MDDGIRVSEEALVNFPRLPGFRRNIERHINHDGVAGQADHALHIVGSIRRKRRLEDDDLLALGIAPQRHVPVGEGHARVVADAAHDKVVADQERVLHRARRNDTRLANGAIDQEEGKADPEPSDDLALNLRFHRHDCFFFFLFVSLHVPPPPAALRARFHSRYYFSVHRIFRWARFHALPTEPNLSDTRLYNKTYRTCLPYHRPLAAGREAKDSPANRRRGICRFLRANLTRRSTLRAWACPRRNSRGKSSAGN